MSHGRGRALALVAVAATVGAGVGALEPAQDLERSTFDARLDVRGGTPDSGRVVLVAIDDETFVTLRRQWPFDRRFHARAIRRIGADRPAALGYDVVFAELSSSAAADNALATALRSVPGTVLAGDAFDAQGRSNVLGGGEGLAFARAAVGTPQLPGDGDTLRRVRERIAGNPSFSAQVVRAAGGDPSTAGAPDGTAWIDWPGEGGGITTVPFHRVVRGTLPRGFFAGKVVVVGPTARTLQDTHPTSAPGGGVLGGGTIQAAAVDTLLRGAPLRSVPAPLGTLLVALLAAVGPLAAGRLRGTWLFAVVLATAVAYVAAATAAVAWADLVVPVVAPLLALGVGGAAALAQKLALAALERTRTRDAFSRFVPATVVDQVLDDARSQTGEGVRLGGVARDMTIMVSDLRGFTSFAEGRPPDEVLEVLNRYLGEMSDAILDAGGTLVSYLGDGILAAFGAPVPSDDHAERALAGAQAMLARLDGFNAWLAAEHGLPPFRMGIGLNSGIAMSGNVGSDRRLDYTVIGDVVNTAARLEGMTKGTPHDLFVAQSTVDRLRDRGALVPVASLPVRGREGLVDVWAPQGPAVLEDAAGPEADHAGDGDDEGDEGHVERTAAGGGLVLDGLEGGHANGVDTLVRSDDPAWTDDGATGRLKGA